MKWRVVVPANDNCRAKTTQPLSDIGTSNYGGEHRVSRWNSHQVRTPNHVERCQHMPPDKNSSSEIGGNLEWFASKYCSHCSTSGNEDLCLFFWTKQQVKRANSPNEWYPYPFSVWGWTKLLAIETEHMSQTLGKPLSPAICHDAWKFNLKRNGEPMWNNNTSAFLESSKELIRNHYVQHKSYSECDDHTYRFPEEDETAWILCEQADSDTDNLPSPSSKQQNSNEYFLITQINCPQWKILPQGYLNHRWGQTLSSMISLMVIPQRYSPQYWLGLARRGRV